MSSVLTIILSYILLYRYVTIIFIVFIGNFLIPLPINIIVFTTSAFASQGYFNIFIIFLVVLVTNILADVCGYFITHKYGDKLLKALHVNVKNDNYIKIEKLLRKYAGETIFITRITGPFPQIVNFLSGLIGVPFKKFIFWDVIGNFIDVSFFVFAGYIVGNYWQVYLDKIEDFGLIAFIAIVIMCILFRIIWKRFENKI